MDHVKHSLGNPAILLLFFVGFLYLCFWSSSYITNPLSVFRKDPLSTQSNTTNIRVPQDDLEEALSKASMANKTVIITIINKAYADQDIQADTTMLDLFLESFWLGENTRPLLDNLLIVAIDQTAYDRCLFRRLNCYRLKTDGVDFEGEKVYMSEDFIKMMWRRTQFLIEVLKRGYSFIFTVTQQVYVAEGLSKDSWVKAQAANQSWLEAEASLGRLKEEHAKVSEELKEAISENKSLDAGLKNAEKQAEEQRKQLNATEVNLATERELVKGLRAELQKARENAKAAEQKVQLAKESIEAEKKAAYQLGADETAQQLTEQFASVCREYCDKTWEKALDAAGVPSDSLLRLPGSVYYENDIREIPVDESSAPPPHDASQTSQAPPSTLGASKETGQPGAEDQPADTAKGKDQGSGGEKKTS